MRKMAGEQGQMLQPQSPAVRAFKTKMRNFIDAMIFESCFIPESHRCREIEYIQDSDQCPDCRGIKGDGNGAINWKWIISI